MLLHKELPSSPHAVKCMQMGLRRPLESAILPVERKTEVRAAAAFCSRPCCWCTPCCRWARYVDEPEDNAHRQFCKELVARLIRLSWWGRVLQVRGVGRVGWGGPGRPSWAPVAHATGAVEVQRWYRGLRCWVCAAEEMTQQAARAAQIAAAVAAAALDQSQLQQQRRRGSMD